MNSFVWWELLEWLTMSELKSEQELRRLSKQTRIILWCCDSIEKRDTWMALALVHWWGVRLTVCESEESNSAWYQLRLFMVFGISPSPSKYYLLSCPYLDNYTSATSAPSKLQSSIFIYTIPNTSVTVNTTI